MYSLKHVLWRGAMALSLLTVGVGGVGFQQQSLQVRAHAPACDAIHAGATVGPGFVGPLLVDEDALASAMAERLAGKRS